MSATEADAKIIELINKCAEDALKEEGTPPAQFQSLEFFPPRTAEVCRCFLSPIVDAARGLPDVAPLPRRRQRGRTCNAGIGADFPTIIHGGSLGSDPSTFIYRAQPFDRQFYVLKRHSPSTYRRADSVFILET